MSLFDSLHDADDDLLSLQDDDDAEIVHEGCYAVDDDDLDALLDSGAVEVVHDDDDHACQQAPASDLAALLYRGRGAVVPIEVSVPATQPPRRVPVVPAAAPEPVVNDTFNLDKEISLDEFLATAPSPTTESTRSSLVVDSAAAGSPASAAQSSAKQPAAVEASVEMQVERSKQLLSSSMDAHDLASIGSDDTFESIPSDVTSVSSVASVSSSIAASVASVDSLGSSAVLESRAQRGMSMSSFLSEASSVSSVSSDTPSTATQSPMRGHRAASVLRQGHVWDTSSDEDDLSGPEDGDDDYDDHDDHRAADDDSDNYSSDSNIDMDDSSNHVNKARSEVEHAVVRSISSSSISSSGSFAVDRHRVTGTGTSKTGTGTRKYISSDSSSSSGNFAVDRNSAFSGRRRQHQASQPGQRQPPAQREVGVQVAWFAADSDQPEHSVIDIAAVRWPSRPPRPFRFRPTAGCAHCGDTGRDGDVDWRAAATKPQRPVLGAGIGHAARPALPESVLARRITLMRQALAQQMERTAMAVTAGYRYTTLEDTLEYIRQHRPAPSPTSGAAARMRSPPSSASQAA